MLAAREPDGFRALLAKVARVVMVFMLVFWSSLRVEYLVAFGAGDVTDAVKSDVIDEDVLKTITVDDGEKHADDQLADLVLYQLTIDEKARKAAQEAFKETSKEVDREEDGISWKPVANASAVPQKNEKGEVLKAEIEIASDVYEDGAQYVVVPVWKVGNAEAAYPKGYTDGDALDEVTSATFVKWGDKPEYEDDEECLSLGVADTKPDKNILVMKPTTNGKAKIRIEIDEEAERDEKLSIPLEVASTGFLDISKANVEPIEDQVHGDAPVEPEIVVTYGEGAAKTTLELEKDYTVTFTGNTAAGTATATIAGAGIYIGEKKVEFKIVEATDIQDAVVEAIADQTFTGSPIEPNVIVTYGEGAEKSTLEEGKDYTVEYEDNTDVGVGKAMIAGKGDFAGTKTVEFNIVPAKPELDSVEITFDTDNGVLRLGDSGGELVPVNDEFSFDGGQVIEYQFGAKVLMKNDSHEYTLDEAKEKFADVNFTYQWGISNESATLSGDSKSAADAASATASEASSSVAADGSSEGSSSSSASASSSGGATIDPTSGLMTVSAKGKYKVTCVVAIEAESDEDKDTQKSSGGAQDGASTSSSSSSNGANGSSSGVSTQDVEGSSSSASTSAGSKERQTVDDSIIVNVDGIDDPQGFARPQDALRIVADTSALASSGEGVQVAEGSSVDRTYTVSELENGFNLQTRLFNDLVASGKATAITGQGVALVDVLKAAFKEAGQDLETAPVESVSFENYKGTQKTIPWSFLNNSQANPLLALKSYVHDTAKDGSSAAADSSKLVDNTRFRLLFDYSSLLSSSDSDADDYRWINKIQVNFKTTESDNLTVGISYTPVPKGVYAELVAVPIHMINGKWDCMWEVSTKAQQSSDGTPLVWTRLEGENGQTLRVLTSDDTIGNLYRVTIDNNTNLTNGEENKELVATSDPEELKEGWGVVLSYNPPQAGDMAIFKSSIYNYDGDVAKLEYVWEWSNDGGITWEEMKGEKKSTLKIQTEPVSENGSSSDGSTPTLIYIRVRAIPPDGTPMVSNSQPLTVHVGDEDSDVGGDDDTGRAKADAQKKGGETKPSSKARKRQPVVKEVESITVERPDAPIAPTEPPESTSMDESPQIYINEDVSEQVAEQEQAEQEYVESTTPGARWTQLNTIEPSGDDVTRVLDGNPFAPFVVPFGLGVTAAGGVEKLLLFRRQLK